MPKTCTCWGRKPDGTPKYLCAIHRPSDHGGYDPETGEEINRNADPENPGADRRHQPHTRTDPARVSSLLGGALDAARAANGYAPEPVALEDLAGSACENLGIESLPTLEPGNTVDPLHVEHDDMPPDLEPDEP